MWFAAPLVPLAAWFLLLRAGTGYFLGSAQFTQYNLSGSLQLGHIAFFVLRRISYLFFENAHWICALAIGYALYRRRFQVTRAWKVCGVVFVLQTAVVTVLGGAGLERYLMPAIPLLYILTADSLQNLLPRTRAVAALVLVAGLVLGLFIGPPFWPYPHENNLAMVDLVRLHQQAASFVEDNFPGKRIVTAWPLSAALHEPEMGYVSVPLHTVGVEDFYSTREITRARPDVFILYSRNANPIFDILDNRGVRFIYRNFFAYRPAISRDTPELRWGMKSVASFRRGRQWVEIYSK